MQKDPIALRKNAEKGKKILTKFYKSLYIALKFIDIMKIGAEDYYYQWPETSEKLGFYIFMYVPFQD